MHLKNYSKKEMKALRHHIWKNWTRITTQVLIKVGDIEELVLSLVENGSKINFISHDLYMKQR